MTTHILADEVLIERSKNDSVATYEFEFKGHQFILNHEIESNHKSNIHRFSCFIDGKLYNFGAGRSTIGGGTFGDWPRIEIDSKIYQFSLHWPGSYGFYGIRFGVLK